MNWFYKSDSKEIGPLSESTIRELQAAGVLTSATMVRAENSAEWTDIANALGQAGVPGDEESDQPGSTGIEPIKFHCPHCDQKISVETESAGAATQCPTCGGGIIVPAAPDEALQEEAVADVHEENLPAENTDAAFENSSQPDQAGTGHSFTDRIKTGTKEGWAGIKRHSKQAALIAKAEKLRTVDLRMALHSLGKKCFESGLLSDALAEQFQAIRDLDVSIAEKREKGETVSDETRMATLKRIGKDAAKASHAQALVLKREHLVTELGRQAYARGMEQGSEALTHDFQIIEAIKNRIHRMEDEIRGPSDGARIDASGKNEVNSTPAVVKSKMTPTANYYVHTAPPKLAGLRLMAFCVDGLGVAMAMLLIVFKIVRPDSIDAGELASGLVFTALFFGYFTLMETSLRMASWGKRIFHLQVAGSRGETITTLQSIVRCVTIVLPFVILILLDSVSKPFAGVMEDWGVWLTIVSYIAYFATSLFTVGNRAPHDMLSGTMVVRTRIAIEGDRDCNRQGVIGIPPDDSGPSENWQPDVTAGLNISPLAPSPYRHFDWRFAIGIIVAVGCTGMIIGAINGSKGNNGGSGQSSSGSRSSYRSPCGRCGGSGQLVGQCTKCYGAGTIMSRGANYDGIQPYSQPVQMPCPQCRGGGQMPVPCNRCKGSGKGS